MATKKGVTYSRAGRELMLDTGRRLYMIDQSGEAIEQGLRLAAQKWGGKMQLTGTPEFIKQAIEIAARKDMRIEFKDAAHNTALEAEREKIAREGTTQLETSRPMKRRWLKKKRAAGSRQ